MAEREFRVDIEEALRRSMWNLDMGHMGKNVIEPQTEIAESDRLKRATIGTGYAQLARALQAEREYEDRKLREIKEQHDGGTET